MNSLGSVLQAVPGIVRWLLTAAFVAIIIVLSVTPDTSQPGDNLFQWLVSNTSTWLQKLLHVCAYAAIAGLLVWSMDELHSRRVRMVLALTLCVALGAALEWYQLRVPGRFGNIGDVLLNALGAIIGLLAAGFLL